MNKFYDFLKTKLSIECITELLAMTSVKILKKGELIFSEAEKCKNIFFIVQGNVNLYKDSFDGKRKVIYLLKNNSIFNENILLDRFERTCTGSIAFTDIKLLSIPAKKMKELMFKYPELSFFIIESLSLKNRRLCRQLKNTTTINMDKRVASKLIKLSKDYGIDKSPYIGFSFKVTNTYLAEMLGTNRETIYRSLKKLSSLGHLKYEDGYLFILEDQLTNFFYSK